ncbi:MAG TPA: YgiT-type zinc finger protein [Blastocatellia bacterium]|nr:YgiT-type zinc finger protein [Blastocatellia bacterium]
MIVEELMKGPCSDCGGQLRRKPITQEYEREGVKVKVAGFLAMVCTRCGEIYFEPGASDCLAQAVNALFALALVGKQHKGKVVGSVS